ncbi:SdrD B-like domain-containing protein [Streptomyces sp. NPDC059708]|uniref:SdrD B-like domain-containing protein n=1 Tax=Streptomyces sp. NPDC059708 TaxID=3346916 RepID=UPI00369DA752
MQIGNRVWFDRNRDGVQGPDEQPLPGATVTLKDHDGTTLQTTTTDARGESYFHVKPRTETSFHLVRRRWQMRAAAMPTKARRCSALRS